MCEGHKQTALEFIDAMGKGEGARMDPLLTPDAVTITKGFAQVSGQRSRDIMIGTTAAFKQMMPGGMNPVIKKVIAEGDLVVVEFECDAVLSNGVPYGNQYCFIFSFRDGKICKLEEYFCTVLADTAILPLLQQKGAEFAHGV